MQCSIQIAPAPILKNGDRQIGWDESPSFHSLSKLLLSGADYADFRQKAATLEADVKAAPMFPLVFECLLNSERDCFRQSAVPTAIAWQRHYLRLPVVHLNKRMQYLLD